MKPEVLQNKDGLGLVDMIIDTDDKLPFKEWDLGNGMNHLLAKLKTTSRSSFPMVMLSIKTFLMKMTEYMQKKLNVACLHPLKRRSRDSAQMGLSLFRELKKHLPSTMTAEVIKNEWLLYQGEEMSKDWFVESEGKNPDGTPFVQYKRIDSYWNRVLNCTDSAGTAKYAKWLSLS